MTNGKVNGRRRQSRFAVAISIGFGTLALSAWPALAQVATMPKVKPGQTVWATQRDGTTIRGRVISIAETGLVLKDGDRQTALRLVDIRRIEARDSLRNGAIIGAIPTAVLFGFGAVAASVYDCAFTDCPKTGNGDFAKGFLIGAGIGALIGAGIDRVIPGRRVLYRAPGSSATLLIAPTASAQGAGVGLSLRW
jgi:hypothetical protein